MPTLDETIEALASKPKKVSVDGLAVENHTLPELQAAAEYLARTTAATSTTTPGGMRLTRLIPTGP